ncbi:MAG TPA: hypothetical protein VG165_04460 [Solirubrobacteraceae bacterium]|nr:hypothetical protein [Solirubrobacteraceae bacterium]
MTPASVAGAAPRTHGGREAKWTRETIIEKIRRWTELYGEPPRAADWNPSSAKWAAQTYRIARYHAGDPASGEPWPSLNAAKRHFGGSLTAAIVAAGYEPARPGPKRRGSLAPERAAELEMRPEVRALLGGALASARQERLRADARERQLDAARERAARVDRDLAAARRASVAAAGTSRRRTSTNTNAARAELAGARADAREARRMATRLAARLERAEATIAEVRADRRERTRERDAAADRAIATARLLDDARAELAQAAARAQTAEAALVRAAETDGTRTNSGPDPGLVAAARGAEAVARKAAEQAQLRAARAEREYRELAGAVTGDQRRLSAGELAQLRRTGPSGPSVLAAALKSLARARTTNSPVGLSAALGEVASAAISWQERIR